MAEYKTDAQVNYGWGLSLEMTGKAPAIAKRIFETKADAQAYVDDANDSAIAGLQLSVVNDSIAANNGIYFVSKVGDGSANGVLVKVGSDSEAELGNLQSEISNIKGQIATKADKFTVGDGLNYASNKIDVVIDPESSSVLSKSEAGLKVTIPSVTVPEYTLVAASSAAEGAIKSYELHKDGQKVGVSIDIPKDLVVTSGEVIQASGDEGADLVSGELYLKLIIGNSSEPVYISVKDLVDVYTAGAYLKLEGGQFSVDYATLKTKVIEDVKSEVTDGISSKVSAVESKINDGTSGLAALDSRLEKVEDTISDDGSIGTRLSNLEREALDNKAEIDEELVTLKQAVNADNVQIIDTTASNGVALAKGSSNKSVKVTVDVAQLSASLTGTSSASKVDGTSILLGEDASEDLPATKTVAESIKLLRESIKAAVSGGITGISSPDNSITVGGDTNAKTLKVNVASLVAEGSCIQEQDGKLDLYWLEV